MRGNWDESEPLALAPESSHGHLGFQQQQSPPPPSSPDKPSLDSSTPTLAKQQQQQQETAATYPLTTPAWANLVVKEEPHDEKNNDSGISPGHYTSDTASPHSDRSSTAMMVGVNGLSPNSASSASPEPRLQLDVSGVGSHNHPAESTYDYSRHHLHHHHHHQQLLHHHHAGSSAGSSVGIPSPEDMSRDASMSPPPVAQHLDSNNDSNNNDHGGAANDGGIASSIEHPIVNSQGKVKTFRCKQCTYVAVTKRDFWAHTASHIKPEKLLTCPKCPFVTEYKHHLEYHLRNHFGSKPYKCDKCNYSCVNKSMLNSHLKSHSNVYQFRCADCSYATKYCHSLKLHLRKYQHKPAMVLNADGTPNPLPIIDVYGTRRGPKTKPKKEPIEQQQQQQSPPQIQPMPQQQQSPPPSLVNGLMQQPAAVVAPTLTPQFQFNAMNGINAFNGFNGANALPVTAAASMPFLAGFPYNQIFAGFPMGNPFAAAAAVAAANNLVPNDGEHQQQANFAEQIYSQQQAMMNGGGIMTTTTTTTPTKREASPLSYASEQQLSPVPCDGPVDLTETMAAAAAAPLDLSKPEAATPKQLPRLPGSGNRRKGRAVKLDRRLLENDSDEEMPDEQAAAAVVAVADSKPAVETNVYMQLKHLRTDMQHMYRYICRLEENLCTRQ